MTPHVPWATVLSLVIAVALPDEQPPATSPPNEQIAYGVVCGVTLAALPPELRSPLLAREPKLCDRAIAPLMRSVAGQGDDALIAVIKEARHELTRGFTDADERRVMASISRVIALAIQVSMPDPTADADPERSVVAAENEWFGVIAANHRRLAYEARVSPERITAVAGIRTAVAAARGRSTGSSDDLYPSTEAARHEKRVALAEERIEAGALLAARLIATAWSRANEPDLTRPGASRRNEAVGNALDVPIEPGDRANKPLVGSRHSNVFHNVNCSHAKRIKPGNRVTFVTVTEALDAHRKPCRTCKPDQTTSDPE